MKKIMFNDRYGLTAAVLKGRKTMTRRIVKPTNADYLPLLNQEGLETWYDTKTRQCCLTDDFFIVARSQYAVGEVVAVAQAYKDIPNYFPEASAGWTNKMFVRATEMPHQIRITNIRVERLQDISDEDCMKEGIGEDLKGVQYSFYSNFGYCGQYPFSTPREAFSALIDKVSGKGTWDKNPLVFVYEFELII